LNEREAIERVAEILNVPPDCFRADACLRNGLLYSIDGYSASESLLPWMSLEDWGWKAFVASFSDVVASGGKPLFALYSVGVRSAEEGILIAKGVKEAKEWLGVEVIGGDFNRCKTDRWIDVVAVGRLEGRWLRWVAEGDDLKLVQAGYLGFGSVASLILEGSLRMEHVPEEVLSYTRRPAPPLREISEALARCGARAAIDNSDGWAWSLKVLAESSSLGIEVDELIVPDEILSLFRSIGLRGKKFIRALINSAEDYNVAILADDQEAECVVSYLEKNGVPAGVVGRTVRKAGTVRFSGVEVEVSGWDSFS
jgi:thiamine-monophosphate kinase